MMRLIHQPTAPWLFTSQSDIFTLRLYSMPHFISSADVLYGDPYDYLVEKENRVFRKKMKFLWGNDEQTVWMSEVHMPTHKLRYFFECVLSDGSVCWYGENGIQCSMEMVDAFRTGYQFNEEHRPSWTGSSIWYQIFPDRFYGGRAIPESFQPTAENRWGGTLDGIRDRIPYLQSLGITGIYLNPVFSSPSNHRYDTLDYSQVDEMLGNNDVLVRLAETLHKSGLRLMMDGVFNHASRQCLQFQDILNKGEQSRYASWFCIHDMERTHTVSEEELTPEVMKANPPYENFAFASNMVKWNTDNAEVQEYLIGCAERWTRLLKLDAWRLDVPDEVSRSFLGSFRRRMRQINPELLLVGEIWMEPSPWVQGSLFDGTMNYPLYRAILRFLLRAEINAVVFCRAIEEVIHTLPPVIAKNQMNFIGNHDLARPLTEANGSIEAVQAAWLLLCLLDGELNLYYGDEQAMLGGDDPDNRCAMRWNESQEAMQMLSFVRRAAALRHKRYINMHKHLVYHLHAIFNLLYPVVLSPVHRPESVPSALIHLGI